MPTPPQRSLRPTAGTRRRTPPIQLEPKILLGGRLLTCPTIIRRTERIDPDIIDALDYGPDHPARQPYHSYRLAGDEPREPDGITLLKAEAIAAIDPQLDCGRLFIIRRHASMEEARGYTQALREMMELSLVITDISMSETRNGIHSLTVMVPDPASFPDIAIIYRAAEVSDGQIFEHILAIGPGNSPLKINADGAAILH